MRSNAMSILCWKEFRAGKHLTLVTGIVLWKKVVRRTYVPCGRVSCESEIMRIPNSKNPPYFTFIPVKNKNLSSIIPGLQEYILALMRPQCMLIPR